jgi:hypothetical protein
MDLDGNSHKKVIVDHDLAANSASYGGSIAGFAWSDDDDADEYLCGVAKQVLRGRRLEVFERLITARQAWEEKGDAIEALAEKHGVTVERIYEDLARAKKQVETACRRGMRVVEPTCPSIPKPVDRPNTDIWEYWGIQLTNGTVIYHGNVKGSTPWLPKLGSTYDGGWE